MREHDLFGVRGEIQTTNTLSMPSKPASSVRRKEIPAHDFNVRRQIAGARIAAHGTNPAGTAQLRYHLGADVAGRAGDEDALHRRAA